MIAPLGRTSTPEGWLKRAVTPAPSANPNALLPAIVVTTPPGKVTSLKQLSSASVTTTAALDGTKATPRGVWKLAEVPIPSSGGVPAPPPASVVTTAPG